MALKMKKLNDQYADWIKKNKSGFTGLKKWLKTDVNRTMIVKSKNGDQEIYSMAGGQLMFIVSLRNGVARAELNSGYFDYTLSCNMEDESSKRKAIDAVIDKAIWWIDNVVLSVINKK